MCADTRKGRRSRNNLRLEVARVSGGFRLKIFYSFEADRRVCLPRARAFSSRARTRIQSSTVTVPNACTRSLMRSFSFIHADDGGHSCRFIEGRGVSEMHSLGPRVSIASSSGFAPPPYARDRSRPWRVGLRSREPARDERGKLNGNHCRRVTTRRLYLDAETSRRHTGACRVRSGDTDFGTDGVYAQSRVCSHIRNAVVAPARARARVILPSISRTRSSHLPLFYALTVRIFEHAIFPSR